MPKLSPVSRRNLIIHMEKFGFAGPYGRGKHSCMMKGTLTITIPNPHDGDIRPDLLRRLLRQAGISRKEWESR